MEGGLLRFPIAPVLCQTALPTTGCTGIQYLDHDIEVRLSVGDKDE